MTPALFRNACLLAFFFAGPLSIAAQSTDRALQKFPDVIEVKVQPSGSDIFNFDVTVSSPYDTPQRYADGFRVMGKDGQVYGVRKLVHDHEDEQPFTRDLYDVKIPRGVRVVVVQARDQKYGYGGKTIEVVLPGR
jgi:hypothetical protein